MPVAGIYRYFNYTVNANGTLQSYQQYQADYVRDRTVALVKRFAAGDRPFFVWANVLAPHDGTPVEADDPTNPALKTPAVAARHHSAMVGHRVPRSPALNETDMSDNSRSSATGRCCRCASSTRPTSSASSRCCRWTRRWALSSPRSGRPARRATRWWSSPATTAS